jgi:hypothetical protein
MYEHDLTVYTYGATEEPRTYVDTYQEKSAVASITKAHLPIFGEKRTSDHQ